MTSNLLTMTSDLTPLGKHSKADYKSCVLMIIRVYQIVMFNLHFPPFYTYFHFLIKPIIFFLWSTNISNDILCFWHNQLIHLPSGSQRPWRLLASTETQISASVTDQYFISFGHLIVYQCYQWSALCFRQFQK